MNCPKCGDDCWRDSADVGVGIIYGPYNCTYCGWSEGDALVEIKNNCRLCKKEVKFFVSPDGYNAWKAGAYIQQAFPELSPGRREFMISQMCEKCFDNLFKDEEEVKNN